MRLKTQFKDFWTRSFYLSVSLLIKIKERKKPLEITTSPLIKNGHLKSWSIYLHFSLWRNGGLTATTNINLLKNLGFNKRGTNTKTGKIEYNKKIQNISKDLKHPKEISRNFSADNYVFENIYNQSLKKKITNYFNKIFND